MTEDSIRKPTGLNWPNALTVARFIMALIVPSLVLGATSFPDRFWAGALFAVAAITDFLDGRLARANQQITIFGKIVDPIADKLLTLGAFALLSHLGIFSYWFIIPILIREIGITVLRFYFLYKGVAVQAVKSGKQKMILQIVAISVGYFNYVYQIDGASQLAAATSNTVGTIFNVITLVLIVTATWQTVYSGYIFLRNNRDLFKR